MKKSLLGIGLFLFGTIGVSVAQDCSNIFISEYVEGWSNNKALEIYNPTSQTVDLSQYFVARYSNGSTSSTVANAIQLSGMLAPHDVYVAVIDKRDPNGTGQEAPVWDSLQAKADGFYCPDYNVSNSFYFNGNDALLLAKGTLPATSSASVTTAAGFQIIDIFGKVGENPANETGTSAQNDGAWSTGFPYSTGLGVQLTKDHSMIRKSTVLKGETTNVSFFDPLAQWDSIPANVYLFDDNGDTIVSGNGNPILFGNWFSLGSHSCSCGDAAIENVKEVKAVFAIYPNPSSTGIFTIESSEGVESVVVYNSLGQVVKQQKFASDEVSVKLTDLPGVYIMKVQTGSGVISKRVIIK